MDLLIGKDTKCITKLLDCIIVSEDVDPIIGEPVSLPTQERALLVIEAFEIVVTEKELRN